MKCKNILVKLVVVILLSTSSIFASGQVSDVYLNRMISNYRNYEAFQLSPSMTTEIDQMEVGGSLVSLSKLDVMHTSFYFYIPIYLRWTLGFGFYTPGMVTQNVINENGEQQPETFEVGQRIISANVAYRFSMFSLGMNINYDGRKDVSYKDPSNLSQGINHINNNLIGVDVGATFYPLEKYSAGDLELGLTAQNLTGPVFKLSGTEETGKPNIVFNYRYCGLNRLLTVSGDVSYGSLKELGLSVDAFYRLPQYLGFGLGYVKDYYDPKFVYLSTELRLQEIINRLTRIKFDIGTPVDKITDLSFVYKIGVSAKLYKTREERYAERLYNLAKVAPNNAYNEALKLYKQKKYWEASFKFGYVIAKYPRFYKVDAATYYLASCYEKLQMNDIAKKIYNQGQTKYKTSDYQAKYFFGLENIAYKQNDLMNALNYYNEVEKHPEDTVAVSGARYVAANIAYDRGEYDNVISMVSKVSLNSDYYYYAKYTEALAYVQKNLLNKAINSLFQITNISTQVTDNALKELINKANILTGHIYQDRARKEKNAKLQKKAFESYLKVPNTSMYYDEAIVGLSWSLLKINKPDKAGDYVKILLSMDTPYKAEAYLLDGYVKTLTEDYDGAIKSLEKAKSLASKALSPDEIAAAKSSLADLNRKISDFGQKALSIALSRSKTGREEKVTNLTVDYKKLIDNLDENQSKVMALDVLNRFSKTNYQFVLDEASYSLGTVNSLKLEKEKEDLIRKQQEEEKKQQEELKRLEEEMNK